MFEIKIAACSGYTEHDFRSILPSRRSTYVDVILPKQSKEKTEHLIGYEYLKAAYVGQLLSRIADDFMFNEPNPLKTGCFSFIVATSNWKKLAAILAWVIKGYTKKDFDPDFDIESYTFYEKLAPGESIACHRYMYYVGVFDFFPADRETVALKD